jgi:methionine-rich copper-binding protein CopC
MKMVRMLCALVMMGLGALALAHTHLVKSVPANGATISNSPPRFVLTFAEPAKLTTLSLQKDSEQAQKLAPLPTSASAEISVPAPPLKPGKYTLSWRALSSDGHVMPGTLSFTVGPAAATTSAPGATGS